MPATLDLAIELIRRPSITPEDAGCQDVMIARLARLGFTVERLRFGNVDNFWARRGSGSPLFVFAGHTDVVPPGPAEHWRIPPFEPCVREGYLYGRGAADMKGSLAAMITACETFVAAHPHHRGSIGLLITSDEEGPAQDGTVKVIQHLQARDERIDYCLVGEPSSHGRLGDVIKYGRRGSLNGRLALKGSEGHVAYPERVRNPIHALGSIITALSDEIWDRGSEHFPPTSLQISNIRGGTGAVNVAPGEAEIVFNFRFSPQVTAAQLQSRVQQLIEIQLVNQEIKTGEVFHYSLAWQLSGEPFLTTVGPLTEAAVAVIRDALAVEPTLSTSGGTSDGRFIAPTGAEVVEFGPVNATIHKRDERISTVDLQDLHRVYTALLVKLLTSGAQ